MDEADLVTGHILRQHWFCSRRSDHAERIRAQIAERGAPPHDPVPNTGGWLALYFSPDPLPALYRWARPGWTPPSVGICRGDWTTATVALQSRRARLALVVPAAE